MSRYIDTVNAEAASEVLGVPLQGQVVVAHGYDAPCAAYFCDLEPDCEIGIYAGWIGLTRELSQAEYTAAMQKLGLTQAVEAVALDLPY